MIKAKYLTDAEQVKALTRLVLQYIFGCSFRSPQVALLVTQSELLSRKVYIVAPNLVPHLEQQLTTAITVLDRTMADLFRILMAQRASSSTALPAQVHCSPQQ
jgi:hypothetical protein